MKMELCKADLEKIAALSARGWDADGIAAMLDVPVLLVSRSGVLGRDLEPNLMRDTEYSPRFGPKPRWTDAEIDVLELARREGRTIKHIARLLGCDECRVRNKIAYMGI